MPELAEVEFFRKQWNRGIGQRVLAVDLHSQKRIFRQVNVTELEGQLPGRSLKQSATHGKRLLFRFSRDAWLGLHLGMTGKLSLAPPQFAPGPHDHLVLRQRRHSLVFSDPRMFGQVHFHIGKAAPSWWEDLPPAIHQPEFTLDLVVAFFQRHPKIPIKSALLLQDGFPGIGNWMADEILWQAKIHPAAPAGRLSPTQVRALWLNTRRISRIALRIIGADFSDPPRHWFFHQRWGTRGSCPIHGRSLAREVIGGRTTAWCANCQRKHAHLPS